MEDKTFELMTRMYGEFSEFKNEMKNEFSGKVDKQEVEIRVIKGGKT